MIRNATFGVIAYILLLAACEKKESSSQGSPPAPATEPAPVQSPVTPSGSGGVVAGSLTLGEGVPPSSVAGAAITVEGRPELKAVADSSGNFKIDAVQPGTLIIYAVSADISALNLTGSAQFGVKFPEIVVRDKETSDLGQGEMKPTGGITGSVAFLNNPNNLSALGSDVFVPGTSFIAKSDDQGRFALSGLPEGTYKINALHSGFAVATIDAVQVVSGQVVDVGDVILSLSNGPEGSINVAGATTATINGASKKISTSKTVSVDLRYDVEAALMKISDEPSFLNKAWQPVAKTTSWTFLTDGPKTLYVTYANLNGLESSPYSDDVIIDTEAPSVTAVRILNGWSQSKSTDVPVSVDTTETGSGVAEVKVSATAADLSGASYVPFQATVPSVTLPSGTGSRTVYVRVKDYAGHESAIVSDTIALGAETIIAKMSYTTPLTLKASLNPYLVNDDVVLDSDLILEPGVELKINYAKSLEVKGKLTAIGTIGNRIKIGVEQYASSNECQTYNIPRLKLNGGLPGVSEQTHVQYADLSHLRIEANGGLFENSTFDSNSCTDRGGYLTKTGRDALIVRNNTFTNWGAIEVTEGDALTTISGNTGTFETFYWQKGSAKNTIITGNSVTRYGNQHDALVIVEINDLHFGAGNTFAAGASNLAIKVSAPANTTISRANVTSCERVLSVTSDISVTVEDSVISGCAYFATRSSLVAAAVLQYSNLTISKAPTRNYAYGFIPLTLQRNNISCINASAYCDLHYDYVGVEGVSTTNLTLKENNITCQADVTPPNYGCRGFTVVNNSGAALTATMSLTVQDNFWIGKSLNLTAGATPIWAQRPAQDTTNSSTTVSVWEFGQMATDDMNLTWPATFAAQHGSLWGAGEVGPR